MILAFVLRTSHGGGYEYTLCSAVARWSTNEWKAPVASSGLAGRRSRPEKLSRLNLLSFMHFSCHFTCLVHSQKLRGVQQSCIRVSSRISFSVLPRSLAISTKLNLLKRTHPVIIIH